MNEVSIALLCTLIGAVATLLTIKRNFTKDTQDSSRDFTRMETKLEYISKGVDDIRLDMRDQGRQINDIGERLTRVEESTKSAHHRIDSIKEMN